MQVPETGRGRSRVNRASPASSGSESEQSDRELHVAASGARIGAQLMGSVHQRLCGCAINAREVDLEPCGDVILAARRTKIHLGVDARVRWKPKLLLAGDEPDGAEEAR